jgi:hypothetical protein
MASTSTNKQPLLVDRVFHNHVDTSGLSSGTTGIDIIGANTAQVLVDCTMNDGGIVEDVYVLSRGETPEGTLYKVMFYISNAVDYLRASDGIFIGAIEAPGEIGGVARPADLPRVLAPAAQVANQNNDNFLTAYYVPKGKAIWCTLQTDSPDNSGRSPIVGAQGGFY